jgi:nucleotide-binding universal stress UspA family protein
MWRVLLVIDGSTQASIAVGHVIDLAAGPGQFEAVLLSIQPNPSEWQKRGPLRDPTQDLRAEKTQNAVALACQRLDAAGITYETRRMVGEFAQTVARVAEGECCDLIVIPQQPMGPLARAVLALTGLCVGTAIDKIMPLANVPVTVVTRHAGGAARPGSRHPSSLARITPLSSDERQGRVS